MGRRIISEKESGEVWVTLTDGDLGKYSLGFEFSEEALEASYPQMEELLSKRERTSVDEA